MTVMERLCIFHSVSDCSTASTLHNSHSAAPAYITLQLQLLLSMLAALQPCPRKKPKKVKTVLAPPDPDPLSGIEAVEASPQSDQPESTLMSSTLTSCKQQPSQGSVATLKSVADVEADIGEWIKGPP